VNRVVARFADGHLAKGTTSDFFPEKELFHIAVEATPSQVMSLAVQTRDLKALYFVKDFSGDAQRVDRNEFDPSHPHTMRPVSVTFLDGEVLVGTTASFQSGRPGFFLVPADASSNIERCYVLVAATREIRFL
jgi:hypothetical protein